MTLIATAKAGEGIVREWQRTDPWELQQDVADFIGDELARWYEGRDWTGRKATQDRLQDQAFSLGEGVERVGPLPDGTVIELEVLSE